MPRGLGPSVRQFKKQHPLLFNSLVALLCLVVVVLGVAVKWYLAWNDAVALVDYADDFDQPTKAHYLLQNRIYWLAAGDDTVAPRLVSSIKGRTFNRILSTKLRTLAVIGSKGFSYFLREYYRRPDFAHERPSFKKEFYNCVGVNGDPDLIPILEKEYAAYGLGSNSLKLQLGKSLYLLTGKQYKIGGTYYSKLEGKVKPRIYVLYKDLKFFRKVIRESQGRKRTYEEMLILDGAYFPRWDEPLNWFSIPDPQPGSG